MPLGLVDPYKMAALHRTLIGECEVVSMGRVCKLLASTQGKLTYSVSFSFDEDNLCVIAGDLKGELMLYCQRCLQMFAYNIVCDFTVSPVVDDNAGKALPSSYEPVMLIGGKINLLDLLEDEVILALPQVPMHDLDTSLGRQQCKATVSSDDVAEEQELNNPFQVLQKLKLNKSGPIAED